MSGTLDAVVASLAAEFDDDVIFQSTIPSTVNAPAVIVVPSSDEDWLQPSTVTGGMVQETWDVLAAVSIAEPAQGIDDMRNLSLRIRRAVSVPGAVWRNASGARRLQGSSENTQQVVAVSTVTFHYSAEDHLAP